MCRRVMLSENFVVPARHEANVPVKVLDNGIPHLTEITSNDRQNSMQWEQYAIHCTSL